MSQLIALVTATILLLFSPTNLLAAVGRVTEQTGPTEIVRNRQSLPSAINSSIEMNDSIVTAKSKAQLTFEDATTVKITEQSKLIIDDFVYDAKAGTGKLAIKVALGTARYASGQIAKSNPQSVNVKTPTASIAVRGTDFSMTVDELGRSLIMLLPSCDNRGCVTGAIEVSNETGTVILDVPYQATLVSSLSSPPSSPIIVAIDQANINNMLIISQPPEIKNENLKSATTELDINLLDVDFLKYSELDKNDLDSFKELDINFLDVDLLGGSLNFFMIDELSGDTKSMLANNLDKNLLPKYNEASGLKYYFNDDKSKVTLYRITTHTAFVTLGVDQDTMVTINQDGVRVQQMVNFGGTTNINIIQK